MPDKRKFSIFISSTYEDLKEERQALMGVALESNFIPVGMEQFHAAPANQWDVITKMIDQCDFYFLIIGGRYGSIDESVDKSYTEKEYDYAKSKGLKVLVLVKKNDSITEDKKDSGDNKYDKMQRLDQFRKRVQIDNNTVAFFSDISSLKYEASQTFKNAVEYADPSAGWVRYQEVLDIINEKIEQTDSRLSSDKISAITPEEIASLFQVDGETLAIGNTVPVVGIDDVGNIPVDSAFLLVYAAAGNGQILKIEALGSYVHITASGKQFMSNNSQRESARWEEALDRLIQWGWVKDAGTQGEVFKLTGTGYNKADWLKEQMGINTDNDPRDEIKGFE